MYDLVCIYANIHMCIKFAHVGGVIKFFASSLKDVGIGVALLKVLHNIYNDAHRKFCGVCLNIFY